MNDGALEVPMRTLFPVLMACLLMACTSPIDAEPAAPAEPAPATEALAATEAPADPAAQAHPAAQAFGVWVTDGTTIMVSADGIGPIVAGVESLSSYTVRAQGAGFLELVTDDGTAYRVDLGDAARLTSSALPNLSLVPN